MTFHSSQMFHQRGLSIDSFVITTLLHEAAFLPATLAAAVSYRSLSVSSKAMKTSRQLCLVPEAQHVNLYPHLHPSGTLEEGHRTCCLYISSKGKALFLKLPS